MTRTALIIGGGFAGCAMAHQFAIAGEWDVTLVEAGPKLGAGVATSWIGGHPYTFGPRHFLTQRKDVFDFLDSYLPLRRCNDHEFLTYVSQDSNFYNYPIHEDDILRMPDGEQIVWELGEIADLKRRGQDFAPTDFEEFWRTSVGPTLYNKFIRDYSKKMWMVDDNKKLDTFDWSPKGTTLKSGPRAGWDTAISAYPEGATGYDPYFVLATSSANVMLNSRLTGLMLGAQCARINNGPWLGYDVVVNTISPDLCFAHTTHPSEIGLLQYIGRDIIPLVLPVEYALPPNVYFCYYAGAEKYTRITEYKKFTKHHDTNSTLITLEFPSRNGRFYPMPMESERAKAQRYYDLMGENVYSIGRAGSYDYAIDIDDCIAQAMLVMRYIYDGGRTHPVPNPKDL